MTALRSAVVLLALAAATSAAVSSAPVDGEPPLLVLDVSDSVAGSTDGGGDASVERVLVADGVRVVVPGEVGTPLPRGRSRIAEGLRAARERVAGTARDVWLVSDGRATDGDVLAAARALATDGRALFVSPPPVALADVGLDVVRVLAVDAAGVAVRARVVASGAGRARVTLRRGGAAVAGTEVGLAPGAEVDVDLVDPRPLNGATSYEVALEPLDGTPDDDPRDDRVAFLVRASTPVVVVLDATTWPAGVLGAPPFLDGARHDPAFLDGADAIVLAGRPWATLRDEGAARLGALVAGGAVLVVLGGPDSYGPGGWRGTSLERLLPLRSSAPEGGETAVVIVLDRSGSTGEVAAGAASAALPVLVRAVGALADVAPADVRLAVIAFNERPAAAPLAPGWVRGGDPVARAAVVRAAGALAAQGGTDLDAAIAVAAELATSSGARRRRVLLVTDGDPDHPLDATSFPRARAALARGAVELAAVVRGDARAAAALRSLAARDDDVAVVDDATALPAALLAAFHRAQGRDELSRDAYAVSPFDGAEGGDALARIEPTGLHRLETTPDARLLAAAAAPGQPPRPFAAVRAYGAGQVVALAWGPALEAEADAARRALVPFVTTWAARADRGLVADEVGGRLVVRATAGLGALIASRGVGGEGGVDATLVEREPGVYAGPAPAAFDGDDATVYVAAPGLPRRPLALPARPPQEHRGAGVDEAALRAWAEAGNGRRLAPGERPPTRPTRERWPLAPFFGLASVVGFLVERAIVVSRRSPTP